MTDMAPIKRIFLVCVASCLLCVVALRIGSTILDSSANNLKMLAEQAVATKQSRPEYISKLIQDSGISVYNQVGTADWNKNKVIAYADVSSALFNTNISAEVIFKNGLAEKFSVVECAAAM